MKEKQIHEEIEIPEGITAEYKDKELVVKGPMGEAKKKMIDPKVTITATDKITFKCDNSTRSEKAKIHSYRAHARNLIKGVTEKFTYKLKICSGHFPMNVSVNKGQFIIKNFLGEKVPRVLNIKEGADVKIDGNDITVEGTNREICGQVAADIEQLCRITNRDKRIFQDGIYITNKAGKEIK
ncbi:MAG: 50S ribosomal protein L6 [Candidatus Woesearchaeota archaeon]